MAVMLMPEAAIHKNDRSVTRKYKVGLSGQFTGVQSVSQPCCVHRLSDCQLGFGMAAFDRSHIPTSCLRIVNVCQCQAAFRRCEASTSDLM
jgi:hypothetical protein